MTSWMNVYIAFVLNIDLLWQPNYDVYCTCWEVWSNGMVDPSPNDSVCRALARLPQLLQLLNWLVYHLYNFHYKIFGPMPSMKWKAKNEQLHLWKIIQDKMDRWNIRLLLCSARFFMGSLWEKNILHIYKIEYINILYNYSCGTQVTRYGSQNRGRLVDVNHHSVLVKLHLSGLFLGKPGFPQGKFTAGP